MWNTSLLGGTVHEGQIDDWTVAWEATEVSNYRYRHWCVQSEGAAKERVIAVLMLNPGSLSGNGEGLRKDTTLRVLRRVFSGCEVDCLALNLFDLAMPKPSDLFNAETWDFRNRSACLSIFEVLPWERIVGVLYAYGNFANSFKEYSTAIESRQNEIKDLFSKHNIPSIDIGATKNAVGAPPHPYRWQITKNTEVVRSAVRGALRDDRHPAF